MPSCGLVAAAQVCAVEEAQAVVVPAEQATSLEGVLPMGSVCEPVWGLMMVREVAEEVM